MTRSINMNLFFTILCLVFSSLKSATGQNSLQEKVQAVLEQLVITNEIPGLNFSIIQSNGKQIDFSSGVENITTKSPLNQSHLLLSGSIGKTYAVALLMKLVDDGKVNLEAKITNYIPTKEWVQQIPNVNQLTVKMLLQHTSGLPRWVLKQEVWEELHHNPDRVWTYEDRFAYIRDQEAVHEPGKGWAYSDTNYLLIGLLIETLEKKDYYQILESKVLKPNQLTETVPSHQRDIPNLAMSYSQLPESFHIPHEVIQDGKYPFNPQVEWTGGGIASTTADLARWCKIYYTGDIFSKELHKQITTINSNGEKVYDKIHSYGMGSFIYETQNGVAYGHSGFMPGYNSIFAYYPDLDIAVALQINCDYGSKKMSLVDYLNEIVPNFL